MSAAEWIADQRACLPFVEWSDTADLLADHHCALDALEAVLALHSQHSRYPRTTAWLTERSTPAPQSPPSRPR